MAVKVDTDMAALASLGRLFQRAGAEYEKDFFLCSF